MGCAALLPASSPCAACDVIGASRVDALCVCVACCVVACLCFPSSSRRRLPSGLELRSMAHSSSPGGAWIGGAAYCNPGACVRCLRVLRRAASCPSGLELHFMVHRSSQVLLWWRVWISGAAYWNLGACVRCACCVVPPLALWIGIALHHPQALASWRVAGRRCYALHTGIWACVCVAHLASCRLYGLDLHYIIHRSLPRGAWIGGAAYWMESGHVPPRCACCVAPPLGGIAMYRPQALHSWRHVRHPSLHAVRHIIGPHCALDGGCCRRHFWTRFLNPHYTPPLKIGTSVRKRGISKIP